MRGEIRIKSETADPLALAEYSPLESEDGQRFFKVLSLRPQGANPHMVVARIEGLKDRDAAALLTNQKLYVPRSRLQENEDEDEFYHADLIGLIARFEDGSEIGRISAVHNFGAGDVLEIRNSKRSAMVPFTKALVPRVDLKAGFVEVINDRSLLDAPVEARAKKPARTAKTDPSA